MNKKSLGFIGGGRVTRIFLQALNNKLTDFHSVVVCDTDTITLEKLKKQFPSIQTTDDHALASKQDLVFIALHPPVIMEILGKIKEYLSENSLLISLAPKISIEKMVGLLGIENIGRMIPSATSYINQGFNPICLASEFSLQEKDPLFEILRLLGNTFEVEESKLEGYAIISAMLPTYFWFQWEELKRLSLQMNLDEGESNTAIYESLIAACHLFFKSELNSNEVMDLIPVKPISEHETTIREYYSDKLIPLFEKIKP